MDADTIINKIIAFFGPVANSIKGSVNTAEILRVTLTALVSGGGVLGVLAAYQGDLSTILTSPTPVSLAVAGYALTFVTDLVRRLNHGTTPPLPLPLPLPRPLPLPPSGPTTSRRHRAPPVTKHVSTRPPTTPSGASAGLSWS